MQLQDGKKICGWQRLKFEKRFDLGNFYAIMAKKFAWENVSTTLATGREWDPFNHSDNVPTQQCLLRIKRDIKTLYDDPPPNIFVVADEKNFTVIHALIIGSFDTPYEGGFFYFVLRCPGNYPMQPPWVKNMTTGAGTVRFNPNLYKNGKICLSILGTWPGPPWSPANSLGSCLMSIQSLLGEKPYHNEPGYEKETSRGDSQRYNECIQHETLRVAVCGMVDNEYSIQMPPSLVQVMEKTFLEFYDAYESIARKNLHLNNHSMNDPFGENRGLFQYEKILKRLAECKKKILTKLSAAVEDNNGDSSSSTSDLDDPPSRSDASPLNLDNIDNIDNIMKTEDDEEDDL